MYFSVASVALFSTKCLCKDAEEQYLVCYCTMRVNMVHCGIVFIHFGQERTGFSQGFISLRFCHLMEFGFIATVIVWLA